MKKELMLISQQKITPRISDFLSIFSKQNEKVIRKYIPQNNIKWTGSGREALRQILLHIGIKKVGVPAYTCQVVLEAVKRAGCQPVFYDSKIITEIKDIEEIIKKVDALILCYNFGFLPEIDKIADLCKKNKVILIEDGAQALGATYQGKPAGSFGDYAFYSFGISKNIGFCGGLIASKEEIRLRRMKKFPVNKLIKTIGEVIIAPLFLHKHIYPLSRKLLSSELNKEQEVLSYELPGFAKKVVLKQFQRYRKIMGRRRTNAEYCCKELEGVINFTKPVKNSNPAWLYFTVLDGRLQQRLLREGVELGEMKTFKCLDGKSEKALDIENKVSTFALYRNLEEIKFIIDKVKKVCVNEKES